MNGLPLLRIPGESYLDARRKRDAGYAREYRCRQREKLTISVRPTERSRGILDFTHLRG